MLAFIKQELIILTIFVSFKKTKKKNKSITDQLTTKVMVWSSPGDCPVSGLGFECWKLKRISIGASLHKRNERT